MTDTAAPSTRLYGAQSMTAPLHEVVVKRPGAAFGAAYDNPAHGFLHPVDLAEAQRQHDAFCQVLADLGVRVHQLDAETREPRPHLHVRLGACHRPRRHRPAVGQADAPGRGGADARVGRRPRHPGAGPARRRRDRRRRRHVLAPARRVLHRPVAPHQHGRRGAVDRAGRGRCPRLRRPVCQRPRRVPAPPVGHLADRRRPGRGLHAPAPRRAVRAPRRSGASRSSRCPRRRS